MLTGSPLGKAIDEAIQKKGVAKAAVARHFGIKGPSIYDWINHGRVGKQHLNELVAYFADVVGPEHWGIPAGSALSQSERLTGEIILAAYQEAIVKYEHGTGLNATSFRPMEDADDAALLASCITAQLSADGGISGQRMDEDGSTGTNRGRGAVAGKNRSAEVGSESKPSARQRTKSAA